MDEVIFQTRLAGVLFADPLVETSHAIAFQVKGHECEAQLFETGHNPASGILFQQSLERFPDLPSLETFIEQNLGAYSKPVTLPEVAFADFRHDPQKYPLKTPSGKIEIFSKTLYEMGKPEEIPAVPKYIPEWENPFTEDGNEPPASGRNGVKKYPLQAIGHHSLARVHSTHDNNDWLQEAFPQRIFINPLDAAARGIDDGDLVHVWNERGELVIHARLTSRILPGVVDIPQGAWWNPDPVALIVAVVLMCSHPTAGPLWHLALRSIPLWWKLRNPGVNHETV